MAQEAVHSNKYIKLSETSIKVDMANTIYKVSHDLLCKMLSKFGFSKYWIQWIKACIYRAWIIPIINGRPTNFFKASRGIR